VAALAERLAAWVAGLQPQDVPPSETERARLRVLDTLGLAVVAHATEAARIGREVAAANGSPGAATLLGAAAGIAPSWAAFAHGIAAHCRDFDDTFADSVVHPGSVVVPVALAVGEAVAAPAPVLEAAITVGYEVAARLGAAAGRKFHANGFHATGTVGPFAAAATAAKLHGLDAAALVRAWGLAGSMAGGLLEFMRDGTWSKWLHPGWAAHGGILAVDLAQRGFRGPATVLEGDHGFFAAFLGRGEAEVVAIGEGLGRQWQGGAAHFKYYPCAHVIQPYLDAALALATEHRLAVGEIEAVTCWLAPWAIPIVAEPRAPKLAPATELDAIASLPFQVAAALTDGQVDLATLTPESRARPAVRALAAKVACAADPALGHAFDGRLALSLRSGRTIEAGVAAAAPAAERVRRKFLANAAVLGEREARAVADSLAVGRPYAIATLLTLVNEALRRRRA
jgi:2-methylcitrate dehydratase PrpD